MLPSHTRRWSFISQALGLMVDLDIGTESLRWMGDTRFVLGFLKGVVSSKNYKARIRMKVVEGDKIEMAREARERSHVAPATMGKGHDPLNGHAGPSREQEDARARDAEAEAELPSSSSRQSDPATTQGQGDGPIPPAQQLQPDHTWLTIDSGKSTSTTAAVNEDGSPNSILYFYAGMMPWVSRDLNQWPVATVGQGVVDIVVQRVVSFGTCRQSSSHGVSSHTGVGSTGNNGQCHFGRREWRFVLARIATLLESQFVHCRKPGPKEPKDLYHRSVLHSHLFSSHARSSALMPGPDGEGFPCESFHVEVHPAMAHVVSMEGKFFVSDFIKKHDIREGKGLGAR